jgi:hypothetical protein
VKDKLAKVCHHSIRDLEGGSVTGKEARQVLDRVGSVLLGGRGGMDPSL